MPEEKKEVQPNDKKDDKQVEKKEGEKKPEEKKEKAVEEMTKEELAEALQNKSAEVQRVLGALSKERGEKGEKATLEKEVETLKAKSERAELEKRLFKETGDEDTTVLAVGLYEKLSQGVTDPAEQEKLMKRAAFLARVEKQGTGTDVVTAAAGAMHGGSRGSNSGNGPAPSAVEMGKLFGHSADKIKESDRRPKNLYN